MPRELPRKQQPILLRSSFVLAFLLLSLTLIASVFADTFNTTTVTPSTVTQGPETYGLAFGTHLSPTTVAPSTVTQGPETYGLAVTNHLSSSTMTPATVTQAPQTFTLATTTPAPASMANSTVSPASTTLVGSSITYPIASDNTVSPASTTLVGSSITYPIASDNTVSPASTTLVGVVTQTDTTPPGSPTLLSPANNTSTSNDTPTFDWSNVTDTSVPVTYQILVDNSGTGFPSPEIDQAGLSDSLFTPGSSLSQGTYHWKVRARDGAGNFGAFSSVFSFTIAPADGTPPSITGISDSPDPFSPNNDGDFDTLELLFTSNEAGTYSIDFKDSSSAIVRTLSGAMVGALNNVNWDGNNTSNVVVPDGVYDYFITATDSAGNPRTPPVGGDGSVRVDNTPPSTPSLLAPADGESTSDNTPLFDWTNATDASAVTYDLLVDNNTNFGSPEISQTDIATSSFTAPSSLAEGTYFWKVRAKDAAINLSPYSTVFNFTIVSPDTSPPVISSVSDSPDPFSPNGDSVNDTTTVSFTSDEAGTYTVQILNASLMGGQNITGTMIAGVNNAVWDGSGFSESTVPDGVYSYLIEADDASGNRVHEGLPLGTYTITVDTVGDATPPNHPSLSGLTSWYRAEGNFADSAGNNNGVEKPSSGSVEFVPGILGQSFQLSSSYVEIPNDPSLNFGTGSFTVAAWINANSPAGNIMVHGGSGCVSPIEAGWLLEFGFAGGEIPAGQIGFDVRDNTGQAATRPIAFAAAPSSGEWHHVAGVLDRPNDLARLYVDGQQVATDAIPAGFGSTNNDGKPAIGANNRGGDEVSPCIADGFFSGSIDEVTLHDRPLAAAEIQSMFEDGSAVLINSGAATTTTPDVSVLLSCHDSQSGCSTIELTFANIDANDNTGGADNIPIDVSSDTNTTAKTLQAFETGANTGIFILNIELADGTGSTIAFTDGDHITAVGTFFDSAAGTKTINALFTDADGNSVSQSDSIILTVIAPTNLFLDPIRDVTATTGFTVSGNLSTNTGEPVTGQLITFTGSGVTPSLQAVTTDGVDFIGDVNIVSCPTPAVPDTEEGDCVPDELATLDPNGGNNMVLHLGVGGNITFPENTIGAKLWIQNMGATSFKYIVEEGNGVIQDEAESGGSLVVVPVLQITSHFSTVGGDFVPNGIKKIRITQVGGSATTGSVGIAAIITTNPDGLPAEQHQINFEEFTAGPKTSPFTVNAGHFFTVGFARNVESSSPLNVTAHFDGTSAYLADDSNIEEYDVIPNTAGTQGEGGDPANQALGGSITTATCVTDADNDGICNTWETNGLISGVPGIAGSYVIPVTSDSRKDIYVEIDCMLQSTSGNYCPAAGDLTAVTTAFSRENIDLHITLTGADTNIPFKNPFHIWTDADGDSRNDFANIKLDFFGTPTERSQGTAGTLRSGKDLLELKAQIYHYVVFVKNLNTGTSTACGPSGQAELYGNDFVVSLGCGFTGAKGSPQEIQGTLMHELGHNLGLRHGGLDDDNCKPNHISVMSYSRQVPWAQLAATNSGTTVNWAVTYSREDLDNLNGPLDETAVIENNGLRVTAGQWSGTLPAGYQFKLIWGQPPNIRTGVTGASVNWDNDADLAESAPYSQDLNKIAGMVGCNPGSTIHSPFQSYDEFANLDLKFRDGANMDGLVYPDPDTLAELTEAVLEGVTSSTLTLEPIADVPAGGQVTVTGILSSTSGNPLAGQLITFSGSGAENLPSATTNSTGGYTSSGSAPATVGTDWEVEAHFAGTDNNGPANSNVETYDTLDDTTPPTVTNTEPADAETGVAINATLSATFSEAMNDATITDSTFTLEGPSGPVSGTVTYNAGTNTASFDPASDLAYATTFTATISGTVQDAAGNSMGADYLWSFTTESVPLNITGFYAPVDMEDATGNPIVNSIKTGRSVALKFEVFDNSNVEQTNTSIVQSFKAQKINCVSLQGEPVDPVEVTNTGGTSLRYDTANGIFVQNWKTPSGQGGSCYAVTLTTIDDSSITAYFRLLK